MDDTTRTAFWQDLADHRQFMAKSTLRDLFLVDSQRFNDLTLSAAGLLFDFSKQRVTDYSISVLSNLAHSINLRKNIDDLFEGEIVNVTEDKAALHTELRNPKTTYDEIIDMQQQMAQWVERLHKGEWRGATGEKITHVVNIGIGGSNLGPQLVVEALDTYKVGTVEVAFIANTDTEYLDAVLKPLNPATTLFIIASKSFTTAETLSNAGAVQQWLQSGLGVDADLQPHFVAVTACQERAIQFGIAPKHILPMWDWVGGRYSLWSAIGLPIAIAIGMDRFKLLLAGAHTMDQHFQTAPFDKNMPMLMALLGIWDERNTHAVIPYNYPLRSLPKYLQQLEMESNGKSVANDGKLVTQGTAPIVWGGLGCEGQHAYHQALHQGRYESAVDFIVNASGDESLFANCLSQSRALMFGKAHEEVIEELLSIGIERQEAEMIAPHKVIPGNRPSNTIVLDELSPQRLGSLLALYEHKVYTQGCIWNINSFDQWGVEYGKQIANTITSALHKKESLSDMDLSTQGLMRHYCSVAAKKTVLEKEYEENA